MPARSGSSRRLLRLTLLSSSPNRNPRTCGRTSGSRQQQQQLVGQGERRLATRSRLALPTGPIASAGASGVVAVATSASRRWNATGVRPVNRRKVDGLRSRRLAWLHPRTLQNLVFRSRSIQCPPPARYRVKRHLRRDASHRSFAPAGGRLRRPRVRYTIDRYESGPPARWGHEKPPPRRTENGSGEDVA